MTFITQHCVFKCACHRHIHMLSDGRATGQSQRRQQRSVFVLYTICCMPSFVIFWVAVRAVRWPVIWWDKIWREQFRARSDRALSCCNVNVLYNSRLLVGICSAVIHLILLCLVIIIIIITIIITAARSGRGPSRRCTTMSTVDSTPPELSSRTKGGIVS